MLEQLTHFKWTMLVVISFLSVILNVPKDLFCATIDAEIPREDKLKLIHFNAKNVYHHYCVHCHGQEGKGDGKSFATELEPKPANFADAKFMAKLKDEDIQQVIINGSASLKKSNLCPAWGNTFSEKTIKELVAYIRVFSVPPSQGKEPVEVTAPSSDKAQEESTGATPFIVWPILTLLSAFFICIAIKEWR